MAGKSKTKPVAKEIKEDIIDTTVENMNEEIEEVIEEPVKRVKQEPLNNDDEIEVISLIPNVSYKDNKTDDFYTWENAEHIELMTFETIQNMHRNYKSYFKNMWLKPLDDRVVKKLGL